jgi:DNA-binding NarL/FixJ family response regulator
MPYVYLSDAKPQERSALRLLLLDLKLEIVGEAADWSTTLMQVPLSRADILLIDWDLLPTGLGVQSLAELRVACPHTIVVVLISYLDSRQQAALSAGADMFISISETPEGMAEHLRTVVARIPIIK